MLQCCNVRFVSDIFLIVLLTFNWISPVVPEFSKFLASTGSPGSHSVCVCVCLSVCVSVCDICALSTLSKRAILRLVILLRLNCDATHSKLFLASTGSPGSHSVCVSVCPCVIFVHYPLCRSGRYFVLLLWWSTQAWSRNSNAMFWLKLYTDNLDTALEMDIFESHHLI